MRETALAAREKPRPSTERIAAWQQVRDLFAAGKSLESFERFCADLVQITTKRPREILPLRWNRAQRRFNEKRTGRDVALKARQIGFTTNELARDLWFALIQEHVTVAVVTAPHKTNEPTKKVIRQIVFMLEHLGVDIGARWSGPTVQFGNGSTLTVFDAGGSEAAADKQGRGGTYHRVHVTEAAFFPYAQEVLNALFASIPSVEQGGEYTEESTPNGAGGLFYDHCTNAGLNGLALHFFPWFIQDEYRRGANDNAAVPENAEQEEIVTAARAYGVELTEAQLSWWREQRNRDGLDPTLQEYPHDVQRCFLLSGTCYFDRAALTKLSEKQALPLTLTEIQTEAEEVSPARPFREKLVSFWKTVNRAHQAILRVWDTPTPGSSYLLAVDTASGKRAGDWLVGWLFDRKTRKHVATLRAKVPASEFARWCEKLARAYGTCAIVVERNNHGHTVLHVLNEELHYPAIWRDKPEATDTADLGFWTGPSNRQAIIDDLVDAVTQGEFDTRDPLFVVEARTFIRTESGKVEAAPGKNEDGEPNHDDVIMTAAIGWHVLTMARAKTERGTERAGAIAPFG